jgi:hypothetical protein
MHFESVGGGGAAPAGQVPDRQGRQHPPNRQHRQCPPDLLGLEAKTVREVSEELFLPLTDEGEASVGRLGHQHTETAASTSNLM